MGNMETNEVLIVVSINPDEGIEITREHFESSIKGSLDALFQVFSEASDMSKPVTVTISGQPKEKLVSCLRFLPREGEVTNEKE